MVLTALLFSLGALEVPMPPPPPGMTARPVESAAPLPDDDEVDADDELEALRAVEEESIEPRVPPEGALRAVIGRLGYGTLLRDRLEASLDLAERSGEALEAALPPVVDVSGFDVAQVQARYDIPLEMRPLVVQYIQFFQGKGRKWFRRWMSRSTRYIPLMQPILEAHGLPRDTVYLSMIESGFSTSARSWAAAVGPWQFIPGTAKMFKLKDDYWVDERRDPVKATHAAATYLSQLYANTGHWYLAWAGYNTGGGRVRRLIDSYGTSDFWELSEQPRGFATETKHYVPKLIACALVARNPEAFGFTPDEFDFQPPFEFDEVRLEGPVDLQVVADLAGAPLDDLENLNPELRRWYTPPASAEAPYLLRVPRGQGPHVTQALAALAPTERLHARVLTVRRGDTLSRLAAQAGVTDEVLAGVNGLPVRGALATGSQLLVPLPDARSAARGQAEDAHLVHARRAAPGKRPAGASQLTYVVARGDSLWSIARRFDVHVSELRAWNPSLGARTLAVGTRLTILGAQASTATKAPGSKHTVTPGETLWSLARRYECTVEQLKAWNGLDSSALQPGQELVVSR